MTRTGTRSGGGWLAAAVLVACCPAAALGEVTSSCAAAARRSGVPESWVEARYLVEWNHPAEFAGIPCAAAQTGAKFRFHSGGWFGTAGYSVVGKQKVRVWVKPVRQGDGKTVVLVPVEYEKDGYIFDVTRANLQELAFYVRQALANE